MKSYTLYDMNDKNLTFFSRRQHQNEFRERLIFFRFKSDGCSVRISNLPFQATWGEVKTLFQTNVGEVKHVNVEKNIQGTSKGSGSVQFTDPASAQLVSSPNTLFSRSS